MRIAVFLTTSRALAVPLLARLRARHPGAWFCVFVRDDDRAALRDALAGCEVRRDKPDGGRLRFLRALRLERFDLLVVAWHGDGVFRPLRLAALFAGARSVLAADERGREWRVHWFLPWTWAGHALRRAAGVKAAAVARGAAAVYRATAGLLVGALLLAGFALLHPRRGAAPVRTRSGGAGS